MLNSNITLNYILFLRVLSQPITFSIKIDRYKKARLLQYGLLIK